MSDMLKTGDELDGSAHEARRPRAVVHLPDCPDCDALGDAQVHAKNERVAILTREDLARYRTTTTPYKHKIAAVLSTYKLGDGIECSNPGRHSHGRGALIETRCGILIRLGHICARGAVHGFKPEVDRYRHLRREDEVRRSIDEATRRRMEFDRRREQLREAARGPGDVLDKIDVWKALEDGDMDFEAAMRRFVEINAGGRR